MLATPELQPLTPQDRGEAGTLDLSTPEGVKQFKNEFIANAAKGREIDRLQYFQDLLIVDANGILEQDPNLQAAVTQSGQDPLIWQGVYEGVKNSAEVLQNPDASPQQKQTAQQNLQAYFRITEITRMDIPPNYQNPDVQARVHPVWEATWAALNTWRTFLPEEVRPPSTLTEAQPTPAVQPPAAPVPPGRGPAIAQSAAPQPLAPDQKPHKLSLIEKYTLHNLFRQLAKYHRVSPNEDEIEAKISQALHLSEKDRYRSVSEIVDAFNPLFSITGSIELARGREPVQLPLLEKLFAQTPPELQEAFTQLKNADLAQVQNNEPLSRFKRLVYSQIGLDYDQVRGEQSEKSRAADLADREYESLIYKIKRGQRVSDDELTQAHISRNHTLNESHQFSLGIATKLHQYFSELADKAGVEIVPDRFGYYNKLAEKAST